MNSITEIGFANSIACDVRIEEPTISDVRSHKVDARKREFQVELQSFGVDVELVEGGEFTPGHGDVGESRIHVTLAKLFVNLGLLEAEGVQGGPSCRGYASDQ